MVIHNIIRTNWILATTGQKRGTNSIKLQSREIITPLEDVTAQCVFDFYSMLTNQLPNTNITIFPCGVIMLHLGKHGMYPPGLGTSRYLEISRAMYICLCSCLIPTEATRLHSIT